MFPSIVGAAKANAKRHDHSPIDKSPAYLVLLECTDPSDKKRLGFYWESIGDELSSKPMRAEPVSDTGLQRRDSCQLEQAAWIKSDGRGGIIVSMPPRSPSPRRALNKIFSFDPCWLQRE